MTDDEAPGAAGAGPDRVFVPTAVDDADFDDDEDGEDEAEAPGGSSVAPITPTEPPLLADEVEIAVPAGGKVVLVSDLHLTDEPTAAATAATTELIKVLEAWDGPGVFVIAGDGFELLHGQDPTIGPILDAFGDFVAAIVAFAGVKDHRVVVLPGNHDGQIAWDADLVDTLRTRLAVDEFAMAVDLVMTTGNGTDRVRVEHGNQYDPYNTFIDPRSPIDTPFGHHVVRQVLPDLEATAARPGGLLDGLLWLNDPRQLPEFVGSRLLYRSVIGRLWWLLVPFVAAVLLRFVSFVPGIGRLLSHHNATGWLIGLGIALVVVIVVGALATAASLLHVRRILAETELGESATLGAANGAARTQAARLVALGYAGMISGHTHEPELSTIGTGFYANTGCSVETVTARATHLGVPPPFTSLRRASRVELDAADVLRVRLVVCDQPEPPVTWLERLVTKADPGDPTTPTVVGSLPDGPIWPVDEAPLGEFAHRRRVRRIAAGLMVIAGLLNVASALIPSVGSRLTQLHDKLPLSVPRGAGVLAVFVGLAEIGLARGLRRGYRRVWLAAVVLVAAGGLALLFKGIYIDQAILSLFLLLWLVVERDRFDVVPGGTNRFVARAITVALLAVALTATLAVIFGEDHRVAGLGVALALGLTALLVLLAARPAHVRTPSPAEHAADLERARQIVHEHGGDTLDYFALRDDKQWLFSGDSVVAYGVIDRVFLVSPDPIGPPDQRVSAWADAMDFAHQNGWDVAVLAAAESWLPIYRAAGMRDIYIGDEAIVDAQGFTLKGRAMKSIRGTHNRVAKAGYRVEMHDPAALDPDLQSQLLALMTETRQGEVERGFSMTLSRMFDPRDVGLLLVVCFDPDGVPRAFNQYVPAAAINGFSLDVMRHSSDPDQPNGLTDFVIIETLVWMQDQGLNGLGLNFATMRAVLAEEMGTGPWGNIERKTLHHFSDSMQIESLWKFNQKYDPRWRARFVVSDTRARRGREALALGTAEGEVEIPVVGKLLESHGPDPAAEVVATDEASP